MRSLLAIFTFVILTIASAFPQAATEAALAHGAAASAGAKSSSVIGNSITLGVNRAGPSIRNSTQPATPRATPATPALPAASQASATAPRSNSHPPTAVATPSRSRSNGIKIVSSSSGSTAPKLVSIKGAAQTPSKPAAPPQAK